MPARPHQLIVPYYCLQDSPQSRVPDQKYPEGYVLIQMRHMRECYTGRAWSLKPMR